MSTGLDTPTHFTPATRSADATLVEQPVASVGALLAQPVAPEPPLEDPRPAPRAPQYDDRERPRF